MKPNSKLASAIQSTAFFVTAEVLPPPAAEGAAIKAVADVMGDSLAAVSVADNHSGVGFARSTDGLTFTQFSTATYGVVPELALTTDGRARLYVCNSGVESYVSSDAGVTWTREGIVITRSSVGRAIVCDPTFLASDEASFITGQTLSINGGAYMG